MQLDLYNSILVPPNERKFKRLSRELNANTQFAIVETHDGFIGASGKRGKGTKLFFTPQAEQDKKRLGLNELK